MIQLQQQHHKQQQQHHQQPYTVDTIANAVTVFQLSQDHLNGAPVKSFSPHTIYELQSPHQHHSVHSPQPHFNQNAYTPSPPLQMPLYDSESHYATLQLDGDQDFDAAAARSRSPTPIAPELPARNGQKWAVAKATTTTTTQARLHH